MKGFVSTSKMLFTERYGDDIIHVDLSTKKRCPFCDELLYKGVEGKGTMIQIRCKRCKQMVKIEVI